MKENPNTYNNTPNRNTGPNDHHPKELPKSSGQRRQRTMMIRYGKMGFIGQFRHSEREIPSGITHVVVKSERGMEIGEIISPFCYNRGFCNIGSEKIDQYYQASGPSYPISKHGTIVRFATELDLKDQQHLDANIQNELCFCQQLINKFNLPMNLITAEHLFGGERIIFYFMAEERVDFRELVKELAHQYQTRIEMRQVGARDEARLIADFETCGRECCCKNFLKVLQPINMRMAKLQKATLDPSKISGRCGRLKCCLRFEDEVYTELYKNLPHKNSCVLTEFGHGTVIETQILTQLVKVRLEETGRIIAISIDEILQRDYRPSDPAKPSLSSSALPPLEVPKTATDETAVNQSEQKLADIKNKKPEPEKPKRRRRRRKKKNSI